MHTKSSRKTHSQRIHNYCIIKPTLELDRFTIVFCFASKDPSWILTNFKVFSFQWSFLNLWTGEPSLGVNSETLMKRNQGWCSRTGWERPVRNLKSQEVQEPVPQLPQAVPGHPTRQQHNLVSRQRFTQVETIQGINDLINYPPSVPRAIPLSGGQWRGTCQSIPHDLVIAKVAKVNSTVAMFLLLQMLRPVSYTHLRAHET